MIKLYNDEIKNILFFNSIDKVIELEPDYY